jgi:hypothetical protein
LVSYADQAKAHADHTTNMMLNDLRKDLGSGTDPIELWWNVANSITCCATPDVATAMASALLKLATADDTPVEVKPTKADVVTQFAVVWTAKGSPQLREDYVASLQEAWLFVDEAGPVMTDHAIMVRTVTDWVEHTS